METHYRTQIRVGIFLALGLVAALVSILALGGEKSLFRSYVMVNANLEQVQGLNIGSVVSLSGMTIGNIEKIQFGSSAQSIQVVMKIDKRYQDKISKDSLVEIRTQGALGDKFIYINPGTPGSPTVGDHDSLESGKSTDLMAILSEKGGQAGKIFDIIAEVDTLLKSLNAGNRSEAIMRNFAESSGNLKLVTQEARELIGELRNQNSGTVAAAMKRLDSILTKIDSGQGTLGALVNDPGLHDQLKAMLGGSPRKQYFQSILQNSIEKKNK